MPGTKTKLGKVVEITKQLMENNTPKKCDGCGATFYGKSYPMVDEQFREIPGLNQCNHCYSGEVGYGNCLLN